MTGLGHVGSCTLRGVDTLGRERIGLWAHRADINCKDVESLGPQCSADLAGQITGTAQCQYKTTETSLSERVLQSICFETSGHTPFEQSGFVDICM